MVINDEPKKPQKYDEELLIVLGEKFMSRQNAERASQKSQEWSMVTPSQFRGILDMLYEQAVNRDRSLLQVVEMWRTDEELREYLKQHIEETIYEDPE